MAKTLLKAIIRPTKVDAVKEALDRIGIAGFTVTEVRGHGHQKGHAAVYRGREYNIDLLPKIEVEVVVEDSVRDRAIQTIITAARTGEIGDGRIFAMPISASYGIRLRGIAEE